MEPEPIILTVPAFRTRGFACKPLRVRDSSPYEGGQQEGGQREPSGNSTSQRRREPRCPETGGLVGPLAVMPSPRPAPVTVSEGH